MVLNDFNVSNQLSISYTHFLCLFEINNNASHVSCFFTIDETQSPLSFYRLLHSRPRLHARKGLKLPTKQETRADMTVKGSRRLQDQQVGWGTWLIQQDPGSLGS